MGEKSICKFLSLLHSDLNLYIACLLVSCFQPHVPVSFLLCRIRSLHTFGACMGVCNFRRAKGVACKVPSHAPSCMFVRHVIFWHLPVSRSPIFLNFFFLRLVMVPLFCTACLCVYVIVEPPGFWVSAPSS